jgi:hypothetical protein
MSAGRQMIAKVSASRKTFVVILMAVVAMFALDNVTSLIRGEGLGGNLANAQSLLDDSDAEVAAAPDTVTNIAGTWTGPLTDSDSSNDGTLTLVITQKGKAAAVKGHWTLAFTAGGGIAGKLFGSAKDGTATLDLKFKSHHHGTCIIKAAATLPDSTTMNATFMTTGACTGTTGSFSLTS